MLRISVQNVLYFFFFVGCTSEPSIDLVDPDAWMIVPDNEDPYRDLRADDQQDCNPLGITNEAGVLEVQTDVCPFVTLKQPALAGSKSPRWLGLLTYHSALFSDPAGQGHMAIRVNGEEIWSAEVDIPGEADVYPVEQTEYPAFSKGDPILFHVRNHGANSWKLAYFRTNAP